METTNSSARERFTDPPERVAGSEQRAGPDCCSPLATRSFRKDVPCGGRFLSDEDVHELSLERAEVFEQAEDLVVVALIEFLEIAEVLFQHLLARVGVEDGDVDVEDEAGRLDQHLAVVR